MAGKSAKKRPGTKVTLAEVEIMPDSADGPMHLEATVLSSMNDLPVRLEQAELKDLPFMIRGYAKKAAKHRQETMHHAAYALVYGWACGTGLAIAKKKLPHGQFEQWREEELAGVVGERTAQRYVQLAGRYGNVNELLAWIPSLRQAYIACGMLPEPPENEKAAGGDRDVAARQALVKSIASVQNRLRRFRSANISLDKQTRNELALAKTEIDELFKTLLG